jgi:nitrate reductase beta subunit
MGGWGPFGESSGGTTPIAVENFHMLRERQTTDTIVDPADKPRRVNPLNWDGKGRPEGLFPPMPGADRGARPRTDGTDPADEAEPTP